MEDEKQIKTLNKTLMLLNTGRSYIESIINDT